MHRTHLGGLLAVLVPGALALHWLLTIPLAVGLWMTRTWTAWLAAFVGLTMLWPHSVLITGPLAGLLAAASWSSWTMNRLSVRRRDTIADRWLPHGAGLDGLRARLLSWIYLARHLTWRGRGAGTTRFALEIAHVRSHGLSMEGGPDARNEPLQLLYEHGWRGALVLLGLVAAIGPWLRFESPWSASVVSAAVICCGTSPLRAFRRWLTGSDGPMFGRSIRASFTIYIDHDLKGHLYGAPPLDPELQVVVARTFLNLGQAWMRRYHLSAPEVAGVWRPS